MGAGPLCLTRPVPSRGGHPSPASLHEPAAPAKPPAAGGWLFSRVRGAAFGVLWAILQSRGLLPAESPDCRSRGGRGGGGGRWALGLIHPGEAPRLPPTTLVPLPFGDRCEPLGCRISPGVGGEERISQRISPHSLLPALPGASPPQFLQNGAVGPIFPSCPLLVPACSPRSPAAPLPREPEPSSWCRSSACFFLTSSSSPQAAANRSSALHPSLRRLAQALLPSAKVNTAPATCSAKSWS